MLVFHINNLHFLVKKKKKMYLRPIYLYLYLFIFLLFNLLFNYYYFLLFNLFIFIFIYILFIYISGLYFIMRIIRSEMIITNYIYYIKLFHIHHGDIGAYEFNMK